MGLGVIGNGKGGILLVQLVQALGNLVLLPAGLGHNGHGIAGLREGDALQRNHLPGIAEGIAGLDPFHLAEGADVAAAQLLDLHGLLAPHHVQAAQLLAGAGAAVHHGQIRPDFPGQHLDKGVLAVLVGNRLEHKRRGHAAGRNHEFLRLPVLLGGLVVIALHGIGQQIHNVIHQHQGTQAVDSGAAQHREQAQFPHALAQALNHLGVGKVLAAEELVHKFLAGFGHGFLQGVVKLGNNRLFVRGDLDLRPLEVLHLIGPLVQHVDNAGDLFILIPDGNHQRSDLLAEALPQSLKGAVVIAVVLIRLGDIDKPGHVPLLAVSPRLLQAYGNTVLGGADNDGGVRGPEGLHHLTGKVESARRIQHVDLAALVFQGGHRSGDGDLAAGFLGIVIADRISVRGSAHALDGAGHVEQALCQGGLSASAVSQQADVTDVLYRIAHDVPLLTIVLTMRPGAGRDC